MAFGFGIDRAVKVGSAVWDLHGTKGNENNHNCYFIASVSEHISFNHLFILFLLFSSVLFLSFPSPFLNSLIPVSISSVSRLRSYSYSIMSPFVSYHTL